MIISKFIEDKNLYVDYLEIRIEILNVVRDFYYSLYDFSKQEVIESKDEIDRQFEFEHMYTFMISDNDDDSDVVAVYVNRLNESDSILFDDIDKAYVRFFSAEMLSHLIAELIVDEKLTDRLLTIFRNDLTGDYDLEEADKIATLVFSNDNEYDLIAYAPPNYDEL